MAKSKSIYEEIIEGNFCYTINKHRFDRLERVSGVPNPPEKVKRRSHGAYNFLNWVKDMKQQQLANGGHVVGLLLGGTNRQFNLCTMHARTNGGLYLKTEVETLKAFLNGALQSLEIDLLYIDNMLGLSDDELDFFAITPAMRDELKENVENNPLFKETSVDDVYQRTPRVILYHRHYKDGHTQTVKIINPLLPQELDQELFLTNQRIAADKPSHNLLKKPLGKREFEASTIATVVQEFIDEMPPDMMQELFGKNTYRQNRKALNSALQDLLACGNESDFFEWRSNHNDKRDAIRRLLIQNEGFLREKGLYEALNNAYMRSIDDNVNLTRQVLEQVQRG